MIVLPRIAKHSVAELLKTHLSNDIAQITRSMPDLTPTITYTPVGGQRIETRQLEQLRSDILQLAHVLRLTSPQSSG